MFETQSRPDGTPFVTLADTAPQWLRDAVYAAHDGALPNDWIYEEAKAAYEWAQSEDGAVEEYADARVEIYTKALFQWAADLCGTAVFAAAEEEAKELGSNCESVETFLKMIQYCAIRNIAQTIAEYVEKHASTSSP